MNGISFDEISSLPLRASRSKIRSPQIAKVARNIEVNESLDNLGLVELCAGALCVLRGYALEDILTLGVQLADDVIVAQKFSVRLSNTIAQVLNEVQNSSEHEVVGDRIYGDQSQRHFSVLVGILDTEEYKLPEIFYDVYLCYSTDTLQLLCAYDKHLIDESVATSFLSHVECYLKLLKTNPHASIGEIEFLGDAELRHLNDTGSGRVKPEYLIGSVYALFSEFAYFNPNHIAIEDGGYLYTYRELNESATRIASNLKSVGIRTGDCVGLSVRPSFKQIEILIAILRVGATPVPVDWTFPVFRLKAIFKAINLTKLVCDDSLDGVDFPGIQSIYLDKLPASGEPSFPADVIGINGVAYVLFTSGSTGIPKAVEIRNSTLTNLVYWQNSMSGDCGRRSLYRSSLAFDVGFQEIFSTLCFGGTLIVASEKERSNVTDLIKLIDSKNITRIFVPPVTLTQISEIFDERDTPLTNLEEVIVAGEALVISPAIIRFFRHVKANLINQYGPTETHVATSHQLEGSPLRWNRKPSIGQPIDNAVVYIIDAAGRRCPIGVAGEIVIGGTIANGRYVNLGDHDDGGFCTNLYVEHRDSTCYRTGDVGKLAHDGQIEFIGRRDRQVKLRGYRIELGDIEAHAAMFASVELTAAHIEQGGPGGPFISLIVQGKKTELNARRLREFLAENLPAHMIPGLGAIKVVEEIPLNANGKIDRQRLLSAKVKTQISNSSDDLEAQIKTIWLRFLHADDISVDNDFLEMGGHSLSAIQVLSQVNECFGISLPLEHLLGGTTLRDFIKEVENSIHGGAGVRAAANENDFGASLSVLEMPNGIRVEAMNSAEARHYYDEIFVRNVYLQNGITLPNNATVLDVGANIGLFSYFVLSSYEASRVVAFEPCPMLAESFRHNLNEFAGRAKMIESAISDFSGRAELDYYPRLSGMSSLMSSTSSDRELLSAVISRALGVTDDIPRSQMDKLIDERLLKEKIFCDVTSLSDVISDFDLECIDLLKIDVNEGAIQIIDGVQQEHWPIIRQLVIEHRCSRNCEIEERLSTLGYHVQRTQENIHTGTSVYYTYAVRL